VTAMQGSTCVRGLQGVPKKRTPWFILTITSVNMDQF